MLCFNTFLVIEPQSDYALKILSTLNEIVSTKNIYADSLIVIPSQAKEDFTEQDLIITNYAAIDKNYKIPVKMNLPVLKQDHILFSKLPNESESSGFWSRTYVPFFNEIMKLGKFEDFVYTIMRSTTNTDYMNLIKKNNTKINEFLKWATPQIEKMGEGPTILVDSKPTKLNYLYDIETHTLLGAGNKNKDKKPVGYSETYTSRGDIDYCGKYDTNGNRNGLWKFYTENKNYFDEVNYTAGKRNGEFRLFYNNGKIKKVGTYKDDEQYGIQKEYNRSGILIESFGLKAGKNDGNLSIYYPCGEPSIHYTGMYDTGNLTDTLKEYSITGNLLSTKIYSNGLATGNFANFGKRKNIIAQGSFLNDNFEGAYKSHYENGNLKEEGNYKHGKTVGIWKSYHENSKNSEINYFNDVGERIGTHQYFAEDGKLYQELNYLKDELTSFKNFNKEGKVFIESKKQKGLLAYSAYYTNGVKKNAGNFSGMNKVGVWRYYDKYENLLSEETYEKNGKPVGEIIDFYNTGAKESVSTYENGVLNGPYVSYHPNGKIHVEGWYVDGQRQGYWNIFFIDGTLENLYHYHKGAQIGDQKTYYVTGKLKTNDKYENDILVSESIFDSTGKPNKTNLLPEGTGGLSSKYTNSQTKFSGNYIGGSATGKFEWNYIDGIPKTRGSMVNNVKDGKWVWYNANGKVQIEGNYLGGKKEGVWNYYLENGKIEKTFNYINDNNEGDAIWYYENGKIEVKKSYHNDELMGDAIYYDESGEIKLIISYAEGRAIKYTYQNPDASLKQPFPISSASYKIIAYYKNGNKSKEYEIVKGSMNGSNTDYFFNGKVSSIVNNVGGHENGVTKKYYSNGNVKLEENYYFGELHGVSKYFYENGNVKIILNYKCDQLHGECKYYDLTGKLLKTENYYSGDCISQTK